MFRLLVICGQSWGTPWYGKNAGLLEGLPTGLRDVELTGGHLRSVPGPVATQRHHRAALHVRHEPQRACRRHDQTERVSADHTLPFAALGLPKPIKGVTVTEGHFHDPAMARRAYNLFRAQGESGGEKGFERGAGLALARLLGGRGLRTAQHDDPARGAPATLRAIGHPKLGSRRPLRSGGAPTPSWSAPRWWASRAGRLFCGGHRDAWGDGVTAPHRAAR